MGGLILEIKEILNSVISVFLIIVVGIYGSNKKIITEECKKGLTNILLRITLPLMVIVSFSIQFGEDSTSNIIKAFLYSFFSFIIVIIVSNFCTILIKSEKRRIIQFANVFSNCGFIGFPVIGSIYGAEGVVYASIFNMFFTVFLWTYGVTLYSDGTIRGEFKSIKSILLNPSIVAVYIGIIMMFFKVKLPNSLYESLNLVGGMTTPLSMIIIGCILSKVNIQEIFKEWTFIYVSFTKLIVMPLSIFLFSLMIGDQGTVMKTMILIQAMPAAATTSIFAEKFNNQVEYAAILVFITTLLSIITFPIISTLIV